MNLQQFSETYPVQDTAAIFTANAAADVQITGRPGQVIRIDKLLAVSSDTADQVVRVHYAPASGTAYDLGSVLIPAGSGYEPLPPIDVLARIYSSIEGLILQPGDVLSAAVAVAVTATKVLTVTAYGGLL
jgi:hypothetical protein